VAAAIGAGPVRTITALTGVLQQRLISRACEMVATGEARAVLVVGGEAKHRARVASRAGVEVPEDIGDGVFPGPDEVLVPDGDIVTRMEIERHLAVPVHQYALVESVLAHRARRSPVEQAEHVARLWALASEVAVGEADAWTREPWDVAALTSDADGNRMLATPYRRWCVSDWNVDQAAALLIAGSAVADELGLPVDRRVAPLAAAETNHMVPLPARDDLAASLAWRLIGAELAAATGVPPASADLIELYSCFPAAVQVAALELGIDLGGRRPWTVTGGMTFGGGPLNSYVLQATAAMVRRLRAASTGAMGLVTSVSGMLTKVAGAMWGVGRPPLPFVAADVTHREAALTTLRRLDPELTGTARVVGATVLHERGEPARAVAIVEASDGARSVVVGEDPVLARTWAERDMVGSEVEVVEAGQIR
jgi:acetyl-CoA C-acetyltransferase